jgi:hypothetical protein
MHDWSALLFGTINGIRRGLSHERAFSWPCALGGQ